MVTSVLGCLLAATSYASVGSAQAKRATAPQVDVARTLLEAAFPELVGSSARTTITLEAAFNMEWLLSRHVVIKVDSGTDSPEVLNDRLLDREFLKADLAFDFEVLREATFIGRRVNSERMAAVRADAEAHPEWQEKDLAVALSAAGAKFGPDRRQAFIANLRWKRFVPVFGNARDQVVTFSWRLGRPDLRSADVMTPSWVVKVDVHDSSVARGCYALIFEPIDGNLQSVINGGQCP